MPTAADGIDGAAARVRLVVLDVDGVLTDGSLFYTEAGEGLKRFDVRDGLGIRLLLDNAIDVAVVSARSSAALRVRCEELGITRLQSGCRNKLSAVRALATELGIELSAVCFVGDDLLDVPVLRAVGLAVAVADAQQPAKMAARWVTATPGGRGAVREVAERIVAARVGTETAHARYLQRELEVATNAGGGFGVVIPARYASTRLPGKPLRDLWGKPMIVHVLERARESGAEFVVVATDDPRIAEAVQAAGGEAMLTSAEHASGTDRLAEVAGRMKLPDSAVLVNLQGDEPLIEPELLSRVARNLAIHTEAGIATLAAPIEKPAELFDSNAVKVAVAQSGMALYFSRAPIPWLRGAFGDNVSEMIEALPAQLFRRHIGLYAYRVGTLRRLTTTPPPAVEQAESLEQLRALWLGIGIHVETLDSAPPAGVDTEEDLERVARILLRA